RHQALEGSGHQTKAICTGGLKIVAKTMVDAMMIRKRTATSRQPRSARTAPTTPLMGKRTGARTHGGYQSALAWRHRVQTLGAQQIFGGRSAPGTQLPALLQVFVDQGDCSGVAPGQ